MRIRVLLPLLLFGLIAVVAVLIPVGTAIADSRTQQLSLQRSAALDQVVQRARTALVQGQVDALQAYLERFHATYGESVLVLDETGDAVASAGSLPLDADVRSLAAAAARAIPQRSLPTVVPWGPGTATVAVPVIAAGDLSTGVVVLRVDLGIAQADVARGWAAVAAIGVLLLAVLVGAATAWTRWILRPVRALDSAVAALAAHRDPAPSRPTGPPELRRLRRAFDTMARDVEDSLDQQRGFVADASHQLRNPLAAIRFRIDALPRSPDTAADIEAVDGDLDRLEHTVRRMLVLADAEHVASVRTRSQAVPDADLAPRRCTISAATLADRHRERVTAAGLLLRAPDTTDVDVPCGRADLEEMVDVLVDNAVKYAGAGAVIELALNSDVTGVELTVEDSGSGLEDADLSRLGTRFWRSSAHQSLPGTGLGLAIVVQLMRGSEGRMLTDRSAYGGLRVRLRWPR